MAINDVDLAFSTVIDNLVNTDFSIPKVSTATIVIVLDKLSIQLSEVATHPGLSIRTKKGKGIYKSFFNSITVMFDRTKAMKVFSNGKLHITGCTTVQYAIELTDRLIQTMEWKNVIIKEKKILTLNTTIRTTSKTFISLGKLFDILDKTKYQVRYTPDIYQGLIIKKEFLETGRTISALVFYTGSVIVCGVQKPSELGFGLSLVHDVLSEANLLRARN